MRWPLFLRCQRQQRNIARRRKATTVAMAMAMAAFAPVLRIDEVALCSGLGEDDVPVADAFMPDVVEVNTGKVP